MNDEIKERIGDLLGTIDYLMTMRMVIDMADAIQGIDFPQLIRTLDNNAPAGKEKDVLSRLIETLCTVQPIAKEMRECARGLARAATASQRPTQKTAGTLVN